MSKQHKRDKRARLFEQQDGKCFWCGKQMRLVVFDAAGAVDDDAATLDHLYPRNSDFRRRASEKKYVCACFKCNNGRSDAEYLPMMDVLIFGGLEGGGP